MSAGGQQRAIEQGCLEVSTERGHTPEKPAYQSARPAMPGMLGRFQNPSTQRPEDEQAELQPEAGASSSSAGPVPSPLTPVDGDRQGRGPDQDPKDMQPRAVERAAGEAVEEWTSFDVGRSLRMLRVGRPAQMRNELRKLHLRWWHASRAQHGNMSSPQQESYRR